MSWSEADLPRRTVLAAVLAAAALAGGCFQPLYSDYTTSTVGGSVKTALRGIEIPEIKGLIGHYFRNELVFELDGSGEPDAHKTLRLEAAITESIQVITVDYANGRADSAALVATATWKLTRQGSDEVVSSGTNSVRIPYERSAQRFATVRAARDAQVRAAKNLAAIVRGQIAADLTA
ncbi:LPS assembly lipoprotein LptE [Bosea sp. (in: a-proteobacteria)]|uniref:LPS assembly lipoprotein LptE n=1 Tax=Bosea sp. (in: a-proteobacteria) TaxID=1871050 RepID=UPI0026119649|nr:LPS assembly lipoprotein LptE [Bosea sp. (in: a-proteobacteria)]MCO5090515.1 LPS assembly lipoprotein LptE [Bosea sp. (in: a-proteobacteria)]